MRYEGVRMYGVKANLWPKSWRREEDWSEIDGRDAIVTTHTTYNYYVIDILYYTN